MSLKFKAIDILKTFDKNEFKRFEEFIEVADYFEIKQKNKFINQKSRNRKNKIIIKFFSKIKDFYPNFNQTLSNKILLAEFKSKENVRKLFSQLGRICEHFMVLEEINTDKYYYNEALLFQYQGRNLKYFFENYRNIIYNLDYNGLFNIKDFQKKATYQLINFMAMNQLDKFQKNNAQLKTVIRLQTDPSFNFLFYFVFDSMKVIVNIIGHANSLDFNIKKNKFFRIFTNSFPAKTLKEIVNLAIKKSSSNLHRQIIRLYWLNYLFRTTESDKAGGYFIEYFFILDKIARDLSIDEKYDFYQEKIFGFWLALKDKNYERVEFEFYESYFNNKAYLATGMNTMKLIDFKNIINRAYMTGRYSWVKQIVSSHLEFVSKEYHENLLNLHWANIFFAENKYKEAILKLENIKKYKHYTEPRDKLGLLIKIYYHIGEYELAINKMNSLRRYFNYHKVSHPTTIPFRVFMSCVMLLINHKTEHDRNNARIIKEKIIKKIDESESIFSKHWLSEQVQDLS